LQNQTQFFGKSGAIFAISWPTWIELKLQQALNASAKDEI
jgi:hypothetical protein